MDILTKHSTANNSVVKIIAAFLFVALPFIGFVLGTQYQSIVDTSNQITDISNTSVTIKKGANTTSSWKTYSNAKYKYTINYPSDWLAREYSDSKNGAAFQIASKPVAVENETITASVSQKVMSTPPISSFEGYARVAAINEIQNYKELASFQKIVTKSGVTGYKTTWFVAPPPMVGAPNGAAVPKSESGPITYFEVPNNPSLLLRVVGEGAFDAGAYTKMLDSVQFETAASSSAKPL